MGGTDIIMLRKVDEHVVLEDRWAKSFTTPALDEIQSVDLLNYSWNGNNVDFSFRRKRDTADNQDIALFPKPITLSWAVGKNMNGHVKKSEMAIDLFRGGFQKHIP